MEVKGHSHLQNSNPKTVMLTCFRAPQRGRNERKANVVGRTAALQITLITLSFYLIVAVSHTASVDDTEPELIKSHKTMPPSDDVFILKQKIKTKYLK